MDSPSRSLRAVAAYDAFLIVTCVLSVVLSTVVHEVVGHCGVAALFGARVNGIELGLVSGTASYELPYDASSTARLASTAGGMAVDLVLGILALAFARRPLAHDMPRWRVLVRVAAACLSAACLFGALGYLAFGLYAGVGDPASLAEQLDLAARSELAGGRSPAWVLFALATPIVGFAVMRTYLPLQERLFPARNVGERLATTTKTMGVVVTMFLILAVTVGRATDPTGLTRGAATIPVSAVTILGLVLAGALAVATDRRASRPRAFS